MRVLVLGATGHIGLRLMEILGGTPEVMASGASRGRSLPPAGHGTVRVDTRDEISLTATLRGFDAVVNCVAGSASAISEGSLRLVQACQSAGCARIVHLSTMVVYGQAEGLMHEDAPLDPATGWYGRAKFEAEAHLHGFAHAGGQAVILRPGCVFGPGSELWVGRTARWLQSRRLGDLGPAGDGWSNLVHVDDVCRAVVAALQLPFSSRQVMTVNLAAPDSPRWNDYFVDLALATGATPVSRLSPRQLQLDAWLAGPPLKLAQLLMSRRETRPDSMPDPMPPGLLRLWRQHIRLDVNAAGKELGVNWTPYPESLRSSAAWFREKYQRAESRLDKPLWTH